VAVLADTVLAMTSGELLEGRPSAALQQLERAIDEYLGTVRDGGYERLSDADLLAELCGLEKLRRQLPVADHRLLPRLERRDLARRLCAPGVAGLLQSLLRLSAYEARSRVHAARLLGPVLAADGSEVAPQLPAAARMQEEGQLSVEQAKVIARTVELLPEAIPDQVRADTEQRLVTAAESVGPRQLGLLGQRMLVELDPAGVLTSDADHERHRRVALIPQHDGSYVLQGRLTPGCGAQLLAWLGPRSAPRPIVDGGRDGRSAGQRLHDALAELASLAVRRTELVDSGAPAQVIVTMTADQLAHRQGWGETSQGQCISVPESLRLGDEAIVTLLIQRANGAVLASGRTSRIANRRQTLALIARDRGCSFPDCDRPPEWTQRHHVVGWADGGPTDVDNLTLLCGYHHRHFEVAGWRCEMRDGLPWWTPPKWLDPLQRPRLNHRIVRPEQR